jgi:Domain of unknown function (DUF5666)
MRQQEHRRVLVAGPAAAALSLCIAVAAALVSCGGGGGVVGSGGTGKAAGVTVGTVNGFGSVIVDGLRYEDASAPVYQEVGPGNDVLAAVRLGHRVMVDYEVAGVASLVRIEATLAGPVNAVATGGTQFTMLGQTVTTNTGASSGPITQFGGGYARAADVRTGDAVEVHGLLVRQTGGYMVQATRIEKLAAMPAYLRVTGLASNATGGSVTLGALTVDIAAATVLPAGTALADGQTLTVLAAPATLIVAPGGAAALRATQVRVRTFGASTLDDYVSGAVSHIDTTAKTFTIGSLLVRYGAANLLPAGATLAERQYVLVGGKVGVDGALAASNVTVRKAESDEEGELKGNIADYVAATRRFTLRGVSVDASAAAVSGCPVSGLADGLYVEVHGGLVSSGLRAKTVQCESESSGATVERSGTVASVDVAAQSFMLTTSGGTTLTVKWTGTTYFGGVSPATLTGKRVEVEGQLAGTVLAAGKVQIDN